MWYLSVVDNFCPLVDEVVKIARMACDDAFGGLEA